MLPIISGGHSVKCQHLFELVFRIYKQQFPDIAVNKGLIHSSRLAVASDGSTPVRTDARMYRKRICNCKNNMALITVTANDCFHNLTAIDVNVNEKF